MHPDTLSWLQGLKHRHQDLDLTSPAPDDAVRAAIGEMGMVPSVLQDLLLASNGLRCRSFRLFPVYDENAPKKTWESLQRANSPGTTEALGGDPELLRRFLVFADIGNGYALYDRNDGTIWFEEAGKDDASQTDLGFREFVELMVENAE